MAITWTIENNPKTNGAYTVTLNRADSVENTNDKYSVKYNRNNPDKIELMKASLHKEYNDKKNKEATEDEVTQELEAGLDLANLETYLNTPLE